MTLGHGVLMNTEENAVKAGLKKVLDEMNKTQKIKDLNPGFNEGVRRGREWILIIAFILSFITFAVVLTATLITVGKVDGRSEATAAILIMEQKAIKDEIALMDVKYQKLKNEVNKK